jgi:adenine deaminase
MSIVLKGGFVVNVFSGEISQKDIKIEKEMIVGIGDYKDADSFVDISGKYVIPGLIDGHIHIESSMLVPAEFAKAVIPHGTTTVIADPHEIVNVAGKDGFIYMKEASENLPVDFFYNVPSCVPATEMETSGGKLNSKEMEELLQKYPDIPGIGEMMNYPGVLSEDKEVLEKIALGKKYGKVIDGHCPGLSGDNLNKYIAAGITTEHECSTLEEAKEKLEKGMHILIREGSAAKNLKDLLPLINNYTHPFISFACDDRHPEDLINEGHIDNIIKVAMNHGVDPVYAVKMATLNTARLYGLKDRGAIAPGYLADLVILDDLKNVKIDMVYKNGLRIFDNEKLLYPIKHPKTSLNLRSTVKADIKNKRITPNIPEGKEVKVIQLEQNQITTKKEVVTSEKIGVLSDILYISVIERYGKNGNIGMGLVKGFGLKNGALASTVAHDSHNIIVVGTNEDDMRAAVEGVIASGGGLAVALDKKVIPLLPLGIGGLMTEKSATETAALLKELHEACKNLGCTLNSPFLTLSFLALPVIPELKITDKGLFDVNKFEFTELL